MTQQKSQFHEDSFCPVMCPMNELKEAIKFAPSKKRLHFLKGVRRARILIGVGAGGDISKAIYAGPRSQFHEDNFFPVTCSMNELKKAIKLAPSKKRQNILKGVRHTRIIIGVGVGGEIGKLIYEGTHLLSKKA